MFEPSELAERMLTEQDEEVRLRDIPERMQVRYVGLQKSFDKTPTDEEVEAEGIWVARELARAKGLNKILDSFTTAVKYVVSFITKEYLEVPFIVDHRRDYFVHFDRETDTTVEILTNDDLWKIYDLDFKYQSFVNRKAAFREFLAKCVINDEYVNTMIEKAEKIEEIVDLSDYVHLKYSDNINAVQRQQKGPKRPASKSLYDLSLQTKIGDFLPVGIETVRLVGCIY